MSTTEMVSVLLCHHNMRGRVVRAIECYLSQTWPNKELIVVDDGDEPIADLVKDVPGVTYIFKPAANLAEKRNAGIRVARGEFICHFDADDWSSPYRLADQVAMMGAEELKLGGYGSCYFWNENTGEASRYSGSCLWGATLIYRRQWALGHLFDEKVSYGEDLIFVNRAFPWFTSKPAGDNMVCVLHSANQKPTGWPVVDRNSLPKEFFRGERGRAAEPYSLCSR